MHLPAPKSSEVMPAEKSLQYKDLTYKKQTSYSNVLHVLGVLFSKGWHIPTWHKILSSLF